MCRGCDEDITTIANETGEPVEVVGAVYNALAKLRAAEQGVDLDAEIEREEREPIGEDAELADAFAKALIGGGAVAVVRPVLLGADPYVLVRVVDAPDGKSEMLAVESGGLDECQRIAVTEAALHTMRDPDSPAVLPDGTVVGERMDPPPRAS